LNKTSSRTGRIPALRGEALPARILFAAEYKDFNTESTKFTEKKSGNQAQLQWHEKDEIVNAANLWIMNLRTSYRFKEQMSLIPH
jgi:hypothetical protein